MNEMTVSVYQKVNASLLTIGRAMQIVPDGKKAQIFAEYQKTRITLRDMENYCRDNMGRTIPTDHYTSLKYDEVTIRRIRQAKAGLRHIVETYPASSAAKSQDVYKDYMSLCDLFIKHFTAQIEKGE